LADQVALLTYAADRQTHYMMRGYKAPTPVEEHEVVVQFALLVALHDHTVCAGKLLQADVTHWATIPSMPAKPGEHPLRRLVRPGAPGEEVVLTAAASSAAPRAVDINHFSMSDLPTGAHVLLIDDTWTRGGHVPSAAIAARKAGAKHVSALVVARWIETSWQISDYGTNDNFMRERCKDDYDPSICPWTGRNCP